MKQLIKKLKELKNKYPIEDYFDWEVPKSVPIKIPCEIINNFDKNIYLKENFADVLINDSDLKNHYWIIQEWGGIKSLKQNDRNNNKLKKLMVQLEKGKLTKEIFGLISSFSKVASFIDPTKYVIYDSRVIFSLNWLLFNYTSERALYPQPSSRNKALAQYDMNTIFNLTKQKYEYRTYKDAYHNYCNLMKTLTKEVYPNGKIYQLEMLLFIIAPEEIVNSIKNNVDIKINI